VTTENFGCGCSGGARTHTTISSVISGFRRDVPYSAVFWQDQDLWDAHVCKCKCNVDEICALLEYYAVSSNNPLPTFRDSVSAAS
jgi:hypothetical protein